MRKYNVESPKQGSKRLNSKVRRNTLPIWVYNLLLLHPPLPPLLIYPALLPLSGFKKEKSSYLEANVTLEEAMEATMMVLDIGPKGPARFNKTKVRDIKNSALQ